MGTLVHVRIGGTDVRGIPRDLLQVRLTDAVHGIGGELVPATAVLIEDQRGLNYTLGTRPLRAFVMVEITCEQVGIPCRSESALVQAVERIVRDCLDIPTKGEVWVFIKRLDAIHRGLPRLPSEGWATGTQASVHPIEAESGCHSSEN